MKSKVTLIAFIILLFYVFLRDVIYIYYPVHVQSDWAYRDIIMNIPRLICLIVIITVQKLKKLESVIHVNATGKTHTFYVGFFLLILIPLRSFFLETQKLQSDLIVWIILGSFLVGFFEEGLFRGLLFDSLKKQLGSLFAIVFSAVLFSIFHLQVVPFNELPSIFLIGCIFALLRDKNVSLFMLSLLHSVYDVFIIFWLPITSLTAPWLIFEMICLAVIALVFYICEYKDFLRKKISD